MDGRASLNISLPDALRRWVDETVRAEGYGSASELIRELVRAEQKRRATDALERLLLASLNSGPPRELSKADWEAMRKVVRERGSKAAKKSA